MKRGYKERATRAEAGGMCKLNECKRLEKLEKVMRKEEQDKLLEISSDGWTGQKRQG